MTDSVGRKLVARRAVLVGGAMVAAGLTAQVLMPRKSERGPTATKIDPLMPSTIAGWTFTTREGVVQTQETTPIEGYDQLITRVYTGTGLPTIMLLIAYGSTQGGSLQLHRPETCYPGEGFSIRNTANADLRLDGADKIAAQTFTAVRDERVEHLLYWTRISEYFPRTTSEEYLGIIRRVVNGIVPDGVLVRLSTIGTDAPTGMAALDRFASGLIWRSPDALRRVLIGSVRAAEVGQRAGSYGR